MEKIRWGVLGTAGIARDCSIPGMQKAENCERYGIAGRSLKKAEDYKDMFGFEKAYEGYEALLSDPKVQAVYTITGFYVDAVKQTICRLIAIPKSYGNCCFCLFTINY